jgi:large subunit ribosomal protein L6
MSRIGKLNITIPEKVTVTVDNTQVKVDGPKGTLQKNFNAPVTIKVEDGSVKVTPNNNSRFARAMHGTAASIISNMIQGVVQEYQKQLVIQGVGFRATVNGKVLDLELGYSHPIHYNIPEGITITVNENTKIKVQGIDKQLVGAVAAQIKHYRKPEPYKGKGVHIQGEFVRRKEGKTVG